MSEDGLSGAEMAEVAQARHGPWKRFANAVSPGIAFVIFGLGLMTGIPLAIFGFDILMDNAPVLFAALLALLGFVVFVTVLVLAFRRPIWERLFRFGAVEMDRFARPLANVARYAAEQKVQDATQSAQELAELVLARYSWIATRRWLVATVTAFIAAIAALAGSALLFQQNNLLRVQNDRVTEQVGLLQNQIELGEAQRSTSIVPEILAIGDELGNETSRLNKSSGATAFGDDDLSAGLRGRIVAALNAARPYRYLRTPLAYSDDLSLGAQMVARRDDLPEVQANVAAANDRFEALYGARLAEGELIDRPVSPERGQIISLLFNAGVYETEYLNFFGADFSFAEVRLPLLANMSFQQGDFRYADFSTTSLNTVDFGASRLDGARFRFCQVVAVSFSSVPGEAIKPPAQSDASIDFWRTSVSGADFRGAGVFDSQFDGVNGLAMNFDGAVLDGVSFVGSAIGASTFRQAIIGSLDFTDTNLQHVDFDGAIVFDEAFLDTVAGQAAEGTFRPELFELEAVDQSVIDEHPQYGQTWRFEEQLGGDIYRVVLVGAFEDG